MTPDIPPRNIAADLEDRAEEVPNHPGMVYEDGRTWTFAEMDQRASAAAAALERAGAGPGKRVAVNVPNGPELVFLLYGAWKLGAVPVAISALYNASELEGALAKTRPIFLIAAEETASNAHVAAGKDLPVRLLGTGADALDLSIDAEPRRSVEVGEHDEAVVLFTGGTTGHPKAVAITHAGAHESTVTLARAAKARPGPYPVREGVPPNIVALPLFHSGGQFTMRFAIHVGRGIVLLQRFRLETLARMVEQHRPDNLFLLPTMVYDIVHAETPIDLSSVRSVLIAGQAISPQLQRAFEEHFEIPIAVDYGSTEIGQVAGWTARDRREGRWKPGSVGRVYDGVRVEIRDLADGRPLPPGEVGEVVVGSMRTPGYVNDEQATRQLVVDGWIHSGDIGYLDEENVLYLVGRKRDMIKCGGFQVWPQEIEDELRSHPLVRDVRVAGVPDDRLGEIPCAYVVRETDPTVDDEDLKAQLIDFARDRLAHFKAPRRVELLDELPRSEVGKVRSIGLPDTQADHQ